MPYLGSAPATSFLSMTSQSFTGGSGTSFTLNKSVSTTSDIAVFVNNVRQSPVNSSYSVSGTTLTMSASIASSDNFYVVFLGSAVGTINPASGSVGTSQLADSSVSLAKLSATGTKDATTFLRGDNSFAEAGGGKVLQVVKSLVTTKASTSSSIPQDNTIPQNTEGTEFTTLAITPQASDSTLFIDFLVHGSLSNNNTNLTVCLFKDSVANALQVSNNFCGTNTELFPLMLKFAETSGTTSSVTYKIRFGLNGGGTVYLNSAIVPRYKTNKKGELFVNFSWVEFAESKLTHISHRWYSELGEIFEEEILF